MAKIVLALCLGLCIVLYWNTTMVLAICLGLYIGLHWQVKRSVDNHDIYGENRRHIHRHWDKD